MSLSSAGLALTLSFSKFHDPEQLVNKIYLLKMSWVLFGLAVISTIIGFLCAHSLISVERKHIYEYYIEGDEESGEKSNLWGIVTFWVNRFSAVAFILAMITTIAYMWVNT